MKKPKAGGELRQVLAGLKNTLWLAAGISAILNVLVLGGSLYMLMVYDSVLPSQSLPTLFGLAIMVLGVYAFQALFDIVRAQLLGDVAATIDQEKSPRVQQIMHMGALRGSNNPAGAGLTPLRDLDQIRSYLSSPGPSALMDLPWVLFFILVLSLLHIWLGVATIIGAIIMIGLTVMTDRATRAPTETLGQISGQRQMMMEEHRRHIEMVHAMGMSGRLQARWGVINNRFLGAQMELARATRSLGGASRVFRMALQSAVLTVGALLVISGKASGGVIFASSILSARALSPIDQAIANWRNFAAARLAWHRLEALLDASPADIAVTTALPAPKSDLSIEDMYVIPPGAETPSVQNISFQLHAGEAMGVIGPSAAGKSSLVRAIVNAWEPVRGSVRLDGAALDQWDPEVLGAHIGYLPQNVGLMTGTIAENIGRFNYPPDSEAVIAAAKAAGVHEMILQMPHGYDTFVGDEGGRLSSGQRQRIGLARALYNDPFLVVLDEPNSNLDTRGEAALDEAIQSVRDRGGIAIVVAHRPAAIARCNMLLLMRDGVAHAFGPRDEILARFATPRRVEADTPDGKDVDGKVAMKAA